MIASYGGMLRLGVAHVVSACVIVLADWDWLSARMPQRRPESAAAEVPPAGTQRSHYDVEPYRPNANSTAYTTTTVDRIANVTR